MLALGASIGGIVTALAGRNVAFVVNALSFFASAFFIARTRYDATPPPLPRPKGLLALTGITDLVEGVRYVRQRIARRGADVRQGRLGAGRRRPAAADDLRPARLSAGRRIGGGHRRALRRARHRRRARTDRAALDPRAAAAASAPVDRAGLLHRRRLLRRAGVGADAVRSPRCACCARISADRFCGCSARCCCRWRCRIASAAGSSPPSWRW